MLQALVVEDDPNSGSALAELIELYGCAARTATTLAEARAHIRAHIPDVLFIDRRLPDGNGLDLLEALPAECATEVIVVTGDASTDVPSTAGRPMHLLVKPVDIAQLRHLLATIAEQRARSAPV